MGSSAGKLTGGARGGASLPVRPVAAGVTIVCGSYSFLLGKADGAHRADGSSPAASLRRWCGGGCSPWGRLPDRVLPLGEGAVHPAAQESLLMLSFSLEKSGLKRPFTII